MEVEPNIAVIGVMEGIEMVPPPCTDTSVYKLIVHVMDDTLLVVVIEGKYRYKPGLEGLLVGVPMYNKTSG